MNILFVGDSYSERSEGYPSQVAAYLGAKYVNLSAAGSSLNYMFIKLEAALKQQTDPVDVVVITITSGDRMHHRDFKIIGGFPLRHDGKEVSDDIRSAIDMFYMHLWDPRNTDVNLKVFNLGLAMFTLTYPSVKFILLPAFSEWILTPAGNYVAITPMLRTASELDPIAQQQEFNGIPTSRNNHLSDNQNTQLANTIVHIIKNYVPMTAKIFHADLTKL